MQVDPIKPKLKPPGTKRLTVKYDVQFSTSAVKFNSRRYCTVSAAAAAANGARGVSFIVHATS